MLLTAIISLVGIVLKGKSDEAIARIPIDATSTAEARLTQAANQISATLNPSGSTISTNDVTSSPVWSPNPILQDEKSFPLSPTTIEGLSVGYGEVYVGIARRFAVRTYNYSTMELSENIPYTVFVIKGPNSLIKGATEVVIEISDGSWQHWVNVYDDNFISGIVIDRVEQIRKLPDFSAVGYKKIEIPIPYPYNLTVTPPSP